MACQDRGNVGLAEIPKMGMFIPNMGAHTPSSNLANGLFTPVQQRVLGLLYGQPDRRFQSAELIRLANSGTGAVHRQLSRLAASGLITTTKVGNQKHYQANHASPVFPELHGLIAKTVGIADPIRRALAPHADAIRAAFVYGSVAKGTEGAASDIDLMVVSDSLDHQTLYASLQPAERALARQINATLVTGESWRRKRSMKDSLAERIWSGPRIMVVGTEHDLA